MKKLLVALAMLLGIAFLFTRFAELNQVLAVFRRGELLYVGLALLVEAGWIYNLGAFYQSIYRVLGMEEKRSHSLKLVTAAYFLTVVAPSAGLSAMAIYLADARRRGRSSAKVTVAGVLYVWFEYIGTLAVLVLGLTELARRNHLHWPEITAALILIAGALGLSLLLYLGLRSTQALGSTLTWLARAVNTLLRPFLRRNYLAEERARSFALELADGLSALRQNPRRVSLPLLLCLANKAILLLVLFLCFQAFAIPVTFGTLVAGLSIAHLFLIVSPTPAGVGIVEGVLAVALNSLGVPLEDATVVTLSYRGFSFWLPFLVGMVSFRLLEAGKRPARLGPAIEAAKALPEE